jgi:uncharacterized protein
MGTMPNTASGLLDEIVARILEVARPEKIILFGSAVHGKMGPNSDVDMLIVAPNGTHRRHLAQQIYQNMIGVGSPVDIIVITPEDIAKYQHKPALVIEPALREGRVIYEREAATTG